MFSLLLATAKSGLFSQKAPEFKNFLHGNWTIGIARPSSGSKLEEEPENLYMVISNGEVTTEANVYNDPELTEEFATFSAQFQTPNAFQLSYQDQTELIEIVFDSYFKANGSYGQYSYQLSMASSNYIEVTIVNKETLEVMEVSFTKTSVDHQTFFQKYGMMIGMGIFFIFNQYIGQKQMRKQAEMMRAQQEAQEKAKKEAQEKKEEKEESEEKKEENVEEEEEANAAEEEKKEDEGKIE